MFCDGAKVRDRVKEMDSFSGSFPTRQRSPNNQKSVSTTGGGAVLSVTRSGKNASNPFDDPKNISPVELFDAAPNLNSFPGRPLAA